jgi:hypothetical protein
VYEKESNARADGRADIRVMDENEWDGSGCRVFDEPEDRMSIDTGS